MKVLTQLRTVTMGDVGWPVSGNQTEPELPGLIGMRLEGPWMQQQILFSLSIGAVSLLVFGVWKRHYPSMYLGQYTQQGSALPYDKMRNSILGWILPVVLYSDHSVLHMVGLDGAVALLFLKMGFAYLVLASLWAAFVLIPVNYYSNGTVDGLRDGELDGRNATLIATLKHMPREPLPYLPFPKLFTRDALYENTQLLSTYVYSLLALYVLWRTYTVFIRFRQGHALTQLKTQTARTVEVREIPTHLANEEALISYFRELRLEVECLSVLQDTKALDVLLLRRIQVLRRLERTWSAYVGDPARARNYDPEAIRQETLALRAPPTPRAAPKVGAQVTVAGKKRPTVHASWNPCAPRVDAIDALSFQFAELDRAVQEKREQVFVHGHTAFVTFTHASSAQIASQVVHYPRPGYCETQPAVEPRDIIWVNEEPGVWDRRFRQGIMAVLMAMLLVFTLSLSGILGYLFLPRTIKDNFPWLYEQMQRNLRLNAFVRSSLPTLLLISINGLVPIAMQYSTYFQRIRSRSRIDHSVLNKYYLYLLFSVVFVFAFSNVLSSLQELAKNPASLLDKLANSLPGARNVSLSYVIFQGLALQPFQLIQLPTVLLRQIWRLFVVNTPRDRAHAIQPPTMSVSTLYPQALLIFTLSLIYSIVAPLIVVFGAMYFAVAYVVLKYQLLNVFDKPYDSHGHAWPLAVTRCIWALLLFQVYQLSLFSVRKQVLNSLLIVPLLAFTGWFLTHVNHVFGPLTSHLSLYDIYSISDAEEHAHEQHDEGQGDRPATRPFEPALAWNHPGLLNDGLSQYGQPALTSTLPSLWLPENTDVLS